MEGKGERKQASKMQWSRNTCPLSNRRTKETETYPSAHVRMHWLSALPSLPGFRALLNAHLPFIFIGSTSPLPLITNILLSLYSLPSSVCVSWRVICTSCREIDFDKCKSLFSTLLFVFLIYIYMSSVSMPVFLWFCVYEKSSVENHAEQRVLLMIRYLPRKNYLLLKSYNIFYNLTCLFVWYVAFAATA